MNSAWMAAHFHGSATALAWSNTDLGAITPITPWCTSTNTTASR